MKRLYRSRRDRILGGVCVGLGDYFEIDPSIVRLLWAALSLLSLGTGIIVYIIAWVLVPEQPGRPGAAHPEADSE